MTTRADLLALLSNPESSAVEFKQDAVESPKLVKELVAFSNFDGGQVLLGVDDSGSPVGLTRPNLEEWVMTACRDKIRPPLIPSFEIVRDVEGGKDVAIVRVTTGYAVHAVWHNHHLTYYIRVGSESREASTEELARLQQQRGAFRAELRPLGGSSLDDLDLRRLRDYFVRIRQQEFPDEVREDVERLLINTELLAEEEGAPATVAGMLLFGRRIPRFLPQSGIDAAAYPGHDKDYATIERASMRGPLVALLDGRGQLIERGLVEQAVDFVRRTAPPELVMNDGARRAEHSAVPDDVLREVIVNALVHRDYLLTGTDVELSVYADRVEVVSPGRLPNGVTTERMLVGIRAARNQLLKDVMRDYGYLEHMGMGVPRTVVRGMQAHNGTMPRLEEDGERFTVTLLR